MMRRKGRRSAAQRLPALGAAAQEYVAMGWPVCQGAQPSLGFDGLGMPDPGRACSCDRIGCPAPGAHPVSPTWQMQATVDSAIIGQWWETRPEANVILATGRVFDVLDVPAVAGATALARMAADGVETGPVAVQLSSGGTTPRTPRGMPDRNAGVSGLQSTERMLFFVMTRGAPDDEDEWWSCGLDASPDPSMQAEAVRWHCRDSFVLAPPSRSGTGQDVRWVREPAGRPLPDGLRLLEYLVDACEEEG
jgi:Bifunctional DNA primase/polymerase, N-terminal